MLSHITDWPIAEGLMSFAILTRAALSTTDRRMKALWTLNAETEIFHRARHWTLLERQGLTPMRVDWWLAWDELGSLDIWGDGLYFAEFMANPDANVTPDAYYSFVDTAEGVMEMAQALALDGAELAVVYLPSGGYHYTDGMVGYSHTYPKDGER